MDEINNIPYAYSCAPCAVKLTECTWDENKPRHGETCQLCGKTNQSVYSLMKAQPEEINEVDKQDT